MSFVHHIFKTAQAADVAPVSSVNLQKGSDDILISVLNRVIEVLVFVAGVAAIIYVIYAGIQYITSMGNPDKVKKARSSLIGAVIGIIVITATFFIINFSIGLGNFFNGCLAGGANCTPATTQPDTVKVNTPNPSTDPGNDNSLNEPDSTLNGG